MIKGAPDSSFNRAFKICPAGFRICHPHSGFINRIHEIQCRNPELQLGTRTYTSILKFQNLYSVALGKVPLCVREICTLWVRHERYLM